MRLLSKTTRAIALAGILLASYASAETPGFSVIVHRSNPAENLSLTEVRALFGGTSAHWPNHSKVVLAEREGGSAPTNFLTEVVLKVSFNDYKRNLAGLEFKGAEPVTLRVLNSDQAACKFVFNVPTAVALIATASLASPDCSQVKVVKIEGRLPGQEGYRLK